MVAVIQPSFSAGEVSKRVQARVDLTKRTVAVEKAMNAVVSVTGSLDKRPGTEFIDTTYGNGTGRLIPFVYNRSQTYLLVLTDNRLEVYRDGVQKASIASPWDITDVWDLRYAQYGDQMTIVHPDYAPREILRTADTSWSISTINFTPEQAAPTSVKTIANERTDAITIASITKANPGVVTTSAAHGLGDNDTINFRYNVDMTPLAYGYFKVNVTAATTFEILDPESNTDYSTVGFATFTTGALTPAPLARAYRVTAVNAQTGEESLVGTSQKTHAVSTASSGTPCQITTSVGNGLMTGDIVSFSGTGSILDGERFSVTRINNRQVTLQWMNGEDVDGGDVSLSGGNLLTCQAREPRSLVEKWDNTVSWDKAADAIIYNVYASDGGAYGLIGSTTGKSFRDYYITPDTSIAPPTAHDPFFDPSGGANRYPSAVAYHNQRRIFGNSNEFPNRFWTTQIGNFYNLTWSIPAKDDDAIVASVASSTINDISHMLSLTDLLCLTEGGEFKIDGSGEALTPATVTVTPQSFYGAGGLPPLVAGNVGMLHLQGNVVRDFEYSIASQSFVGNDLTILGRHLLDDRVFLDWAYAHTPGATLLITMEDDLNVPAFTYFPEQEVFGWTHWVTAGDVVSVCSLPEGSYDRLYLLVKRVINGSTYYCIERVALPSDDPYAYHGVDCGVIYATAAKTITGIAVSATTGVITVTAASHGYSNGDIVDIDGVYEVGDDGVAVLSTDFNGDGYVVADQTTNTFRLKDATGAYIDGSGFASYSSRGEAREAVTTVGGLSHLNGEAVVAAANGREVTGLTPSAGSITLPTPASRVSVGLPFTYEVITLPVSSYQQGGTIEGVMKNVNRFALHVISAADFYAGPERDAMELYEGPEQEPYSRQTMMDKSHLVTTTGTWSRNRVLMLQQRSPLPMSIASIIPDALLGDT